MWRCPAVCRLCCGRTCAVNVRAIFHSSSVLKWIPQARLCGNNSSLICCLALLLCVNAPLRRPSRSVWGSPVDVSVMVMLKASLLTWWSNMLCLNLNTHSLPYRVLSLVHFSDMPWGGGLLLLFYFINLLELNKLDFLLPKCTFLRGWFYLVLSCVLLNYDHNSCIGMKKYLNKNKVTYQTNFSYPHSMSFSFNHDRHVCL